MNDRAKTKAELIEENSRLNRKIKALKQSESDREKAEKSLQENEEFFRQIFNQAAVGISILSSDGTWLQVNRRLCDILGYSRDELMKISYREISNPDHLEQDAERIRQMVGGVRNADSWEKRYIHRDGRVIWVRITTALSRDEHGQPQYFITVTEDITARKRVEEALRALTSRQEAILAAVPEIIMEVDNNKVYTWANAGGLEFFGADVIGKEAAFYFEGEQETYETVRPLINGNIDSIYVESWQRRQDGKKRLLAWWCRVLKDERGQVTGALSSARDITEHKQAEEALTESEEKFRKAFYTSPDSVNINRLADGMYVSINSGFTRITGYTEADIIGKTSIECNIWANIEDRQRLVEGLRKDGEVANFEARFRMKSGEIRYGLMSASVIDLHGVPHILNITRDITERKHSDEALHNTLESLRKAMGATIKVMVSAVETRDPYTAGHQLRSANLARAIATEMGLPREKIEGIRMAGSIHDIGKLSIPAEILSKPTKLRDIEFSLIQEHPRKGYEILKDVESSWPLAEIVYQHHERMNGSGYPRKLKGDDILMEARILAVSDVVESMASHRPYRPALGLNAALEEIENKKGVLYDADAADACLRLFREKGYQL